MSFISVWVPALTEKNNVNADRNTLVSMVIGKTLNPNVYSNWLFSMFIQRPFTDTKAFNSVLRPFLRLC